MANPKRKKESGLSDVKMEQLSKMPEIKSSVKKSVDGKWFIHRTTITDIKPVSYVEKVLTN